MTNSFPIKIRLQQVAALLVYRSVFQKPIGQAFTKLLQALHATAQSADDELTCLSAYGDWFNALATANQSWQDYLMQQIQRDDNPFSQQVQRSPLDSLPPALVAAARHDLKILQTLAECESQLPEWVQEVCQLEVAPIAWTGAAQSKALLQTVSNWEEALELLALHYRKQGSGIFAEFRALRWQAGQLMGIADPDRVQLTQLTGYESQKATLLKNTEALLRGNPALHVLLYGSRGSGKSSLVKSLLAQYGDRGLRLIEVAKADLQDLPAIVEPLRNLPQKFIIFVDDLSFEAEEDAFKALKVVLEGNLTARPQNMVVYATSNRRHLIREFFSDRPRPQDADEIHNWDTVQEKLSFSDRFGLTLTFEPADQKTYLNIVHHLATQAGITLGQSELEFQALQWATQHNGRSGRSARQFVDFLQAMNPTTGC
jgi:predicted AAA+ superfamily ATPase